MKFLISCFSALIAVSVSQQVLYSYPFVIPMLHFNITNLLGRWYTYARIPNEYETFADCSIVDMSINNNTLELTMSSLNNQTGFVEQWGSFGVPVPRGFSSQYNLKFLPLARQRDSVVTVLNTDYKNFAVIELIQISEDARILQYAWIWSRSRKFHQTYLNRALDVLQRNTINLNCFELVNHDRCPSPDNFLPYEQ